VRKELERVQVEKQQALNREVALTAQLDKERKAKKRLERRVEKGVCPFPGCKRHFTNLQRHVATEHNGLVAPAETKAIEERIQ
jgi:hypothetical protein